MVGRQLAHFEIVDLLGEGGMGIVYRALDHHLGRHVALKILPADRTSNTERKERFVQEAQAASALNHPNIVTIHDISAADGIDYIAMELVPGRTLEDLLSKRRLKLPEALKYAVQIADALAAAHAAGIVHRDLKPANIMVTETGVVKVLDFGLAKLTQRTEPTSNDQTRTQRALTDERTIVGSAAYMSPEQAEGRAIDARSDIFSFGLVLYEMLSGKRAFEGETRISTIAAIVNSDPVPLGAVAPGLPKELERIVGRCLRKDLVRRSQSIAEIKIALEELREESESGASPSLTPVAGRSARPAAWIAIVASAFVLGAIGIIGLSRWRSAPAALTDIPLTNYVGYQGQPTLSPDGSQFAFVWSGGVERGMPQLYVRTVGGGAPLRLTSTPATFVHDPAWSPDGQRIAFVRNKVGSLVGELMTISPFGGTEKKIDTGPIRYIDWSPDGRWLYFSAQLSLQTYGLFVNSSTGGERRLLVDPLPNTFGDREPSVSPDGRRLVFVRSLADFNNDLFVVDLRNGAAAGAPRRLTFDHRAAWSPRWTTGGEDVIYVTGETMNALRLYRVRATGGSPSQLPVGADDVQNLAIARNGHRLIYGRAFRDYNMYRMALPNNRTPAGSPSQFLSSHRLDASPTFSPDGKHVAFTSNRTGVSQIYVADTDGSNVTPLTSFTSGVSGSPKWSPDGKTIVFDARPDGLADIYSIRADGTNFKRLTDNPAEDHLPCYSVDGRWIYFASTRSGERQLYRIPAAGGDASQVTHHGAMACIASPDGRWIYYSKQSGGLWKIATDGGEELSVLSQEVMLPNAFTFTVTSLGIYYAGPPDEVFRVPLRLYRFADGKTIDIAHFDKALYLPFSVSPDERWFAWTQLDSSVDDLVLIENFR